MRQDEIANGEAGHATPLGPVARQHARRIPGIDQHRLGWAALLHLNGSGGIGQGTRAGAIVLQLGSAHIGADGPLRVGARHIEHKEQSITW